MTAGGLDTASIGFGSAFGGPLVTAVRAGTRSAPAAPEALFTRVSGRIGRFGPSSTSSSTVRAIRLPLTVWYRTLT